MANLKTLLASLLNSFLNTERNFTQNEEIIHVFSVVGGVVNSVARYVDCRSITCARLADFL